jgi:hypothetical protein
LKKSAPEKSAPKNCLTRPMYDPITSIICGQVW